MTIKASLGEDLTQRKKLKLKQANITFDLTIRTVLFSKQPENKLLNHLLLLTRYFIYKTIFFYKLYQTRDIYQLPEKKISK